jgi:hypothetical protein
MAIIAITAVYRADPGRRPPMISGGRRSTYQ